MDQINPDGLKLAEKIITQLKQDTLVLKDTLQALITKQEELTTSTKKSSEPYKTLSEQIGKTKEALKATTEEITNGLKAINDYTGTVQQNLAILIALKTAYDRLSQTQSTSKTTIQQLQINIVSLTGVVNKQTESVKKSKEAFDFHKGSVEAFKSTFDELKEHAGTFGPVISSVSNGFNSLKTGLEVAKTGFQSVGGAIKATGFGLLVLVLQSVTEYLTKNTEGVKKFRGILAGIGVVVEKVKKVFENIRGAVIEALFNPGKTIKVLWDGFVTNLENRFKALGVIFDGLFNHFSLKKITDGVIQLGSGVTNATDKISNGLKKVKEFAKETTNEVEKAYKKAHDSPNSNKTIKPKKTSVGNFENEHAKQAENIAAIQRAYQDSLMKQMQQTANGLASKAKLLHDGYADEQASLQRLYDNKLITQEQYNKESEELELKYHKGVDVMLKRINAEDLEKVKKQQQALVEAKTLKKDQHDVDKAILPWNKLEAEKKLITDKYNFEIQKAAEAGQDTAQLRIECQAKITEATKKSEEQRKDFAIKAAQEISSKAFSIIGDSIKSASEAKIRGMENDKARELSNTSLTKTQKAAIEAKYKKKENEEKVKAFKAEKKMQIAQAVINGAISITKTLATTGLPAAIPLIAADVAMTAIQIATVASQKPPQFARGGQFVSDGRGALLPGYSRTDNTNAYLRSGEAVVVSEAMRNPWARNLVSAINVAHGGRDFSIANPGKGYAIGGIYTDGGNTNRYYNQPVNDVKELANTVAYQMINNFPPIYVDVKDVNNQQNILAQTVDRVNL